MNEAVNPTPAYVISPRIPRSLVTCVQAALTIAMLCFGLDFVSLFFGLSIFMMKVRWNGKESQLVWTNKRSPSSRSRMKNKCCDSPSLNPLYRTRLLTRRDFFSR